METRTILQIVLGGIFVAILGLGGLIIYELTREAETVVVETIQKAEVVEHVSPWADKGKGAIALVERLIVNPPFDPVKAAKEEEKKKSKRGRRKKRKKKKKDEAETPAEEPLTLGALLAKEEFVKKVLRINGKPVGWKADWWEETKHGPHFYLVRYAFLDGGIEMGPQWLVDLKEGKVVAKNLYAKVAENPVKGVKSGYYSKEQQIVSAIAAHRLDSKMSLAGALLLYFEQRSDAAAEDTIHGWTIDHDRGNLFKAYFQWTESGEDTYAEFEFDYDRKALKAVNLQAANIMNVGDDFKKKRVSIMPGSYNPKAAKASQRWTGPSRKACRKAKKRCNALASILDQQQIVENLEWMLTAQANTADEFEQCKADRKCAWLPSPKPDSNNFIVKYRYDLGKEQTVSWEVNPKTGDVTPLDRIAKLAFSVIRAR